MRIPTLLAIGLLAEMAIAAAQGPAPLAKQINMPPTSTLTGCLKGSVDQYFVIDSSFFEHVLLAKGHEFGPYVDHMVTLTGKADNERDASSSSDEGSPRGNRFFSVDEVTDQGPCKK
jgi:hypothetical protein